MTKDDFAALNALGMRSFDIGRRERRDHRATHNLHQQAEGPQHKDDDRHDPVQRSAGT
ncbi:hypothetical protein D3C71_1878500 [compost metagenome]